MNVIFHATQEMNFRVYARKRGRRLFVSVFSWNVQMNVCREGGDVTFAHTLLGTHQRFPSM